MQPQLITVIGRGQVHVLEEGVNLDGVIVRFGDEILQVDSVARANPSWLLQPEDGGPDVLDGDVEVLDGGLDARCHLGPLRQACRALEGEPGGEQTLDDGVVQVAGDALAVFEQGQFPDPSVQAGVLDGDARCSRQAGRH